MSNVTDRPRAKRGVEIEVALSTSAACSTVQASTRSSMSIGMGEAWGFLVGVVVASMLATDKAGAKQRNAGYDDLAIYRRNEAICMCIANNN